AEMPSEREKCVYSTARASGADGRCLTTPPSAASPGSRSRQEIIMASELEQLRDENRRLREAAERLLGCWNILMQTNGANEAIDANGTFTGGQWTNGNGMANAVIALRQALAQPAPAPAERQESKATSDVKHLDCPSCRGE